jgi:hypothetical protein
MLACQGLGVEVSGSGDGAELVAAVRDAGDTSWSVRVAAGRCLAAAAHVRSVAEVIAGLLLDDGDTAVCQETGEALLRRRYVDGLRLVLAGLAAALMPGCPESTIAGHLYGAAAGDPRWLSDQGRQEFIEQLEQLLHDPDASVRQQARRLLPEHRDAV